MKKTLRTLALAALAVFPFATSAQLIIKPVWVNGVENGVANPIPGIDSGWDKPTASNPGSATVCRFAVGKDGSLLMNNHKENAIVAWNGVEMTTYAKLPDVTATGWDGNNASPADAKWNGTAITTDDAGNVIYGYCFIDADKSLKHWGVIDANGKITDIELSTPLSDLGNHGRLDILGHIVGDVNSVKGGIGYATTTGKCDNVIMFHFKGDGNKVTSLTAKSFEVPGLASNGLFVPSPKYLTIDETLANGTPEKEFYLPIGASNTPTMIDGTLACGDELLTGFGNRMYNTSAVFSLGGKKYIVRSYVDPENPKADILPTWHRVMTFGIFDLDNGKCVASWQGSEFANAYGMGTISAEPIDDESVNIYIYVSTTSKEDVSGTLPGGYGGMFTVTAGEPEPDGSKENPYLIATAEELCNAYSKTVVGQLVYFKQTADIDMAGVTEYTALTGYDSEYNKSIYYDGDYHIISNFAPVDRIAGTGANAYYDTTIFGTPSGTIKNLGIVDAKVETDWYEAGILGGFAGTAAQTATAELNIDNVFVTGTIKGGASTIAGGMFGTSGQSVNITNSYVQVEIDGQSYSAGFISKAASATNITNSYASASVKGATTALVVACDPANPADITFNNVIAFGTGEAANVSTVGAATVVPAFDATAIASIQAWEAFNKKDLFNGLPALNWQNNSGAGIFDAEIDNSDAPAVYYNLQGVEVANPDNGVYIVRRGNKVTKELIRK